MHQQLMQLEAERAAMVEEDAASQRTEQQLKREKARGHKEEASASQVHDEAEMAERIRDALQQLPDREREIIVLRRYMELDTAEICEEMGLPTEGAVRALLSRAQARLAGLLTRRES